MKYVGQGARFLVMVQILNQMLPSLATETGDSEENQEEEASNHQGSWSHWWSYDGISGKSMIERKSGVGRMYFANVTKTN